MASRWRRRRAARARPPTRARTNRNQPSSQQVASQSKTSRPKSAPRHCQAPFLAAAASAKAPSSAKLAPRLQDFIPLPTSANLNSSPLPSSPVQEGILTLKSFDCHIIHHLTWRKGKGGLDYDIIGQIIYDIMKSMISCNVYIIDSEL